MERFLENHQVKDYPFDSSVIKCPYCSSTGKPAKAGCHIGGTGYYDKNNMKYCDVHGNTPLIEPQKKETVEETAAKPSEPESNAPAEEHNSDE
jgi:hypothetical protein